MFLLREQEVGAVATPAAVGREQQWRSFSAHGKGCREAQSSSLVEPENPPATAVAQAQTNRRFKWPHFTMNHSATVHRYIREAKPTTKPAAVTKSILQM